MSGKKNLLKRRKDVFWLKVFSPWLIGSIAFGLKVRQSIIVCTHSKSRVADLMVDDEGRQGGRKEGGTRTR